MRIPKSIRIVGVSLVTAAALVLLAVAIFVFNPFEGSLPDLRYAVPRDIDFFVRKKGLRYDFKDFPEPWFWADLSTNSDWQALTTGPTYRAINGNGQVTCVLETVRRQAEQIRAQTAGQLNLLDDFLGTEVQIAGRLPAGRPPQWCAYFRVSWRGRFAHGLLGYGFVQDMLREHGLVVLADGDLLRLQPQGSQPMWLGRHLDAVLLGNERALVQRSLELARGIGDPDSFGGSAHYKDGIENRIAAYEQTTGVLANALEFFVRPPALLSRPGVRFDDGWPDPRHPTDMNQRVIASFVNLQTWLALSGALLFEPGSVALIANIELNQTKHTGFQARFFRTESQNRSEWLDPFLSMVPADACAAAAMRMPAGDFLREMYTAMDQAARNLINDALRKTGKYDSMLGLIDEIEPAFYPRTGFAFRKNIPDPGIPVAAPSPMPQVAWVFWLREGGEKLVGELVKTLTRYREVVGFQAAYDLPLNLGGHGVGGDAAREFTHPQIPATGSIATLVYPPFFVVSNSGPFIRDMMHTRFGLQRSVRTRQDFQHYSSELPDQVNGFIYVNAEETEKVLLDYRDAIANATLQIDPSWALANRARAEMSVYQRHYAGQYGSIAAISGSARAEFDRAVDTELQRLWQRERTQYADQALASVREAISLCRLLESFYLQLVLEPRYLRMTGRAILEFQ